jgi:hypothetical protein
MTSSRIVFIDLETAPSLGYVWGKWEQNVIEFEKDWYVLSAAYKRADEKKVHVLGLNDFPEYAVDKENDKPLMQALWSVLDQADIVIGHNLDNFDVKKANARFITHGMPPPSPYRTLDTLKLARSVFKFDSNKLDELGKYLGVGRKVQHTGFSLWKACMSGDAQAWKLMKKYNAQDVILLEKVYNLMRPWAKSHPNVNQGDLQACPKCGSAKIQRRGFSYTLLRKKQRYQCMSCLGWHSGPAIKVDK